MIKQIHIFCLCVMTSQSAYFQGVINSEKLFNQQVDQFYFVISPTVDFQKGNSDVFEASVQLSSLYKLTDKHWLKLTGGVDMIQENGLDVSNDKFLQFRHTFSLTPRSHTFTFYQLQNSFTLGVKKRQLIGSGVRFKVIKKEIIRLDFGVGVMNEIEVYNYDIQDENKFRVTSMLVFKKTFEAVAIKNVAYFQPNITRWSDFRLLNEFDFTFEINEWLEYEVNYIVRFDNEKPDFLEEQIDQYITSGFNIKFNK